MGVRVIDPCSSIRKLPARRSADEDPAEAVVLSVAHVAGVHAVLDGEERVAPFKKDLLDPVARERERAEPGAHEVGGYDEVGGSRARECSLEVVEDARFELLASGERSPRSVVEKPRRNVGRELVRLHADAEARV